MYNLLDAMSVLSNPNLTFNNNYNALHNFAMNLDKNKKFSNIIDNLISKISKTEIDKSRAGSQAPIVPEAKSRSQTNDPSKSLVLFVCFSS